MATSTASALRKPSSAERSPEQTGQPFRPALVVAEHPGAWRVIGESARQNGRQCLYVVLGGRAHRHVGWHHPLMVPSLSAGRCWPRVRQAGTVVTIDDVRAAASRLPRSYEALVQDRVKFRVGRIVYLALSRDETLMGFGFPKEEREALVASDPHKFLMPLQSDMRYNWARVRLAAIDVAELSELVLDAWRMVVPKRVATAFDSVARQSGKADSSTPLIEPPGAQDTVPSCHSLP